MRRRHLATEQAASSSTPKKNASRLYFCKGVFAVSCPLLRVVFEQLTDAFETVVRCETVTRERAKENIEKRRVF